MIAIFSLLLYSLGYRANLHYGGKNRKYLLQPVKYAWISIYGIKEKKKYVTESKKWNHFSSWLFGSKGSEEYKPSPEEFICRLKVNFQLESSYEQQTPSCAVSKSHLVGMTLMCHTNIDLYYFHFDICSPWKCLFKQKKSLKYFWKYGNVQIFYWVNPNA